VTIDELIVKLILDTKGFTEGQKEATKAAETTAALLKAIAGRTEKVQADAAEKTAAAQVRAAEKASKALEAEAKKAEKAREKASKAAEAEAKKVQAANEKTGESITAVGRKLLGLYALFTAGRGIKEFISDITSADAALGRVAKNVDLSGKALSTWQGAATVAGGSAEGVTGSISKLSSEMQNAALTGQSSIIPVFRALGINLADTSGKARSATDVLLDFNRKTQGMDPARISALGHMAGFDDGTINLLEMSTDKLQALLKEQDKYAANAADIEAAQKRQTGWRELLNVSTSLGRTILTELTPAITGVMHAVLDWANANGEWLKTEIVTKVREFIGWLQSLDWAKIGDDFRTFATNVGALAAAFAGVVAAVSGQSPLAVAFEAFGALLALRILAPLTGILSTMRLIGGLPLTGALSLLTGAGGLAAGALLASTSPLNAGEPTVGPDGRLTYPDGHSERGRVWDGQSQHGAQTRDRAHHDQVDKRNLWQRTMPKWVGGQDAPAGKAHGITDAGRERVNSWMRFFQRPSDQSGMGLPKEKSAAMVAMMQGESGQNLDPRKEYHDVNGPSGGTAAWHDVDGRPGGRLSALKAFAAKQDKDWRDVSVQQQWWKHEAETTHRGAFAAVQQAPDGASALQAGVHKFEVPADPVGETAKRMPNLTRILRGDFDAKPATPAVVAPATTTVAAKPATSDASVARIGDAAYFDAQQRQQAGKPRTGDPALISEYRHQQATPDPSKVAVGSAAGTKPLAASGNPGEVARVETAKPAAVVSLAPIGENDRETQARPAPPPVPNVVAAPPPVHAPITIIDRRDRQDASKPAPMPSAAVSAREPIGEVARVPRVMPRPAPVPSAAADYAREHNAGRPQVPNMPGSVGMLPAGRMMTPDVPRPAPVPSAAGGYGREHNAGRPQMPNMPGSLPMLPAGRMLTLDDAANHVLKTMKGANDNRPIKVDLTDGSATKIGVAGKSGLDMLMARHSGSIRAKVGAELSKSHAEMDRAFGKAWTGLGHHAGIGAGERAWQAVNHAHHQTTTHTVDNSSATHVGEMHVHPQTSDGKQFARDFRDGARQRSSVVTQANAGLA